MNTLQSDKKHLGWVVKGFAPGKSWRTIVAKGLCSLSSANDVIALATKLGWRKVEAIEVIRPLTKHEITRLPTESESIVEASNDR